ncbi:hypothetical protein NEFER03_2130 [Nematocida sp. LUAm3]|nr:hypothetical protein NEFER03_2130 [Nematocida sp. LUAm3]KAI5174478.1 hypothetical protein NEFER02_0599 [Nematocida sp. LUAm2]KAI5177952.1 hypothetical protein NEFER01_1134 [Nematocida sp. LUAm1]
MGVQEVKNSKFAPQKEEKRRRKRVKRTIEEPSVEEVPFVPMKVSSFVENTTNHKHAVYKDFLKNRRNGERLYSINFIR